jgi:energy-coupling factor transporter transmembrane protein EcfT
MSFIEIWGCGNGPMMRLEPQTRLFCTAMIFIGTLAVRRQSPIAVLAACAALVLWVVLSGVPLRMLGTVALAALAIFAPVLLLTPWVETGGRNDYWAGRWSITGTIAAKGVAGVLVSVAGISSIRFGELPAALCGLRLPKTASVLICQIAQQTATLTDETMRMVRAMSVRGVSCGLRGGVRVLAAMPVVWLVRILGRAERTSAAMILRGYDCDTFGAETGAPRLPDRCAAAASAAFMFAMVIARWGRF